MVVHLKNVNMELLRLSDVFTGVFLFIYQLFGEDNKVFIRGRERAWGGKRREKASVGSQGGNGHEGGT
jgi:hypothetical protein